MSRERMVGPSGSKGTPGAHLAPADGFRFAENSTNYPSAHPGAPGVFAFFTYKDGGVVTIVTPAAPAAESPQFAAGELPLGEWVRLQDQAGRPLPIAVQADELGVNGKWI